MKIFSYLVRVFIYKQSNSLFSHELKIQAN